MTDQTPTPPVEQLLPSQEARIYIAARFSRRHEGNQLGHALASRGATITSRWTKPDCDHVVPTGMSRQAADHERERFALEDVEDVRAANWVVSLMEEPRSNTRGGRHIEFGLALALGHRMTIIGPRETVFHHLPQVEHFNTVEDFLFSLPVRLSAPVAETRNAEVIQIGENDGATPKRATLGGGEVERLDEWTVDELRDSIRLVIDSPGWSHNTYARTIGLRSAKLSEFLSGKRGAEPSIVEPMGYRWALISAETYPRREDQDPDVVATPKRASAAGEVERGWPLLDEYLRRILGMMCFQLGGAAHVYQRAGEFVDGAGNPLNKRAEDEQAFMLHKLVGFYFKHGADWTTAAKLDLGRARALATDASAAVEKES